MGLPDGQFNHRPAAWLKIQSFDGKFAVPIQHEFAVGIIYRASIIAWLFLLFSAIFGYIFEGKVLSKAAIDASMVGPLTTLFAIVTALSAGLTFFNRFEAQIDARRKSMRTLATEAVSGLAHLKFPPESTDFYGWDNLFFSVVCLRGGQPQEEFNQVLRLAGLYLSKKLTQSKGNMYYPLPELESSCVFGPETAAHVIALFDGFAGALAARRTLWKTRIERGKQAGNGQTLTGG